MVTGGQRQPSEEVIYKKPLRGQGSSCGSHKDPCVGFDVWEDGRPSPASPHGHCCQGPVIHIGTCSAECPGLSQLRYIMASVSSKVQPPSLCLPDVLPHSPAHLHAAFCSACICASVPNSTRQDDSHLARARDNLPSRHWLALPGRFGPSVISVMLGRQALTAPLRCSPPCLLFGHHLTLSVSVSLPVSFFQ